VSTQTLVLIGIVVVFSCFVYGLTLISFLRS